MLLVGLIIRSVPIQPRQLMKWALKPPQSQADPAPPLDWERIQKAAGHMTVMNLRRIKQAEYKLVKVLALVMLSAVIAAAFLGSNPPMSTSLNPSVNAINTCLYCTDHLQQDLQTYVCMNVCVCVCCILLSTVSEIYLLYLPHCCDNLLKVVFIQDKW